MKSDRGSTSSAGSGATDNELMPKGELSSSSGDLLPSRRARFKQVVVVAFFIIGLIVCVTSLICILLLPTFVTNQISKRLVLKNNSLLLERWSKPNVPMYFKVWVFDVKNAKEVLEKRGTKPELAEIGPFVFHLKRQKDIVSFAGDNLYYTERKLYHFAPELSCCAINTTVTIPNIPLVAVVDRALSYNLPLVGRFIPRLINRAIQSLREQLFVRKQVREILFDGYEVDLLKVVSRIGSLVGLPQTNQKFALLKGRNDTWRPEQDGVWAINTGARDRRLFGRVSTWNSYKQLPFWAAPNCNAINGSDGTLFPPPIKRSEPLYIFNQELCRTVNLVYERPSDIRAIQAYRFVLNPLNFAHTMPSSTATGSPLTSASSNSLPATSAPGRPLKRQAVPEVAVIRPLPIQATPDLKPTPEARSASATAAAAAAAALAQRRWKSRQAPGSAGEPVAAIAQQVPVVPVTVVPVASQPQQARASQQQAANSGASQQREQQRLVLAAQEAQAQLDRRLLSKVNPNTCFCDRKTTNLNGNNVCEFDGLIDLSKCTKQAQVIFGSMPHFYQSDPRLLRQVVGLAPNASKHTTYLDIEPNTGLVLGGKRRVQLNLIIKHNNEVEGFENISDMLVPVVWFEESALIPEEAARKFKSLYTDRIRTVNIVLVSLFLAALGLLAIDTRLLISQYWRCFNIKMNCKGTAPVGLSDSRDHLKSASVSSRGSSNLADAVNLSRKVRKAELVANGADAQVGVKTTPTETDDDDDDDDDDIGDNNRAKKGYAKRAFGGLNLPLLASDIVASSGQQQQASLAGNKSVEFAVHYNDTLLVNRLQNGQKHDSADQMSIVALGDAEKEKASNKPTEVALSSNGQQ